MVAPSCRLVDPLGQDRPPRGGLAFGNVTRRQPWNVGLEGQEFGAGRVNARDGRLCGQWPEKGTLRKHSINDAALPRSETDPDAIAPRRRHREAGRSVLPTRTRRIPGDLVLIRPRRDRVDGQNHRKVDGRLGPPQDLDPWITPAESRMSDIIDPHAGVRPKAGRGQLPCRNVPADDIVARNRSEWRDPTLGDSSGTRHWC